MASRNSARENSDDNPEKLRRPLRSDCAQREPAARSNPPKTFMPIYLPRSYCYLDTAGGRNAYTNLRVSNRGNVVARPGARTAESLGIGRRQDSEIHHRHGAQVG